MVATAVSSVPIGALECSPFELLLKLLHKILPLFPCVYNAFVYLVIIRGTDTVITFNDYHPVKTHAGIHKDPVYLFSPPHHITLCVSCGHFGLGPQKSYFIFHYGLI